MPFCGVFGLQTRCVRFRHLDTTSLGWRCEIVYVAAVPSTSALLNISTCLGWGSKPGLQASPSLNQSGVSKILQGRSFAAERFTSSAVTREAQVHKLPKLKLVKCKQRRPGRLAQLFGGAWGSPHRQMRGSLSAFAEQGLRFESACRLTPWWAPESLGQSVSGSC